MEIKINREIREYTEAMYFGLSLRQFICCGIWPAALPSGLYFLLRPHVGMETDQLGLHAGSGIPFCGLIGFVKYHGMTGREICVGVDQERDPHAEVSGVPAGRKSYITS